MTSACKERQCIKEEIEVDTKIFPEMLEISMNKSTQQYPYIICGPSSLIASTTILVILINSLANSAAANAPHACNGDFFQRYRVGTPPVNCKSGTVHSREFTIPENFDIRKKPTTHIVYTKYQVFGFGTGSTAMNQGESCGCEKKQSGCTQSNKLRPTRPHSSVTRESTVLRQTTTGCVDHPVLAL